MGAYAERAPPGKAGTRVGGWDSPWLVGSDGKGRRKLLEVSDTFPGVPAPGELLGLNSFFWSPDEASLVLLSLHLAGFGDFKYCSHVSIHRLDVASGQLTPLAVKQPFGDSQLLGWSSSKELMFFSRCGPRRGDPTLSNDFLRALPSTEGATRNWNVLGPVLSPGGTWVYLSQQPYPKGAPPGTFHFRPEGLIPVMELEPNQPGFMAWLHHAPEGLFTALSCNGGDGRMCHDSLRSRQRYQINLSTQGINRVSEATSRSHIPAISPDISRPW